METFQTEQSIRTLVDEQLKNLGWDFNKGKNCNVYQEQPRTVEERKKLKGKRPDYVLYSGKIDRSEPIAIIETKKPGTKLDEALKQGNEYAKELDAPIVFATDGIYYKTLHTIKQKPLFLNGEEVQELIREIEAIRFLDTNIVTTIPKEVVYGRKQLIKIFEESNDFLRSEGFRAGIERFGEFSNILFLKLISELEDLKEEEGRDNEVILDKYLRWSEWKNKNGKELLDFVNNVVLKRINKIYTDDDIFTPLQIKNPNTLKKIIEKLDPLNLINIKSDIKGDAFEYFLEQSTETKNDLGEYFTPRHIIKVMIKLLNPKIGERIYDPFCGTGGMLIEAFKHISHNMAHTPDNWKQLREKTLFGNEITTTSRITKMNMILIGDGHTGIQQKDSLKNPVENKYDVVVTNMPYSQKTEYGSYYDLPSTNGDSICIQHCIKAIDKASENGRVAIIVPEGFLFRKDLQKTREYLFDRCIIKSVISLPQGVFLPYAGVKTNILYCTNVKQKKKQDKLWYFDVKNDGYSLDSQRRKLEGKTDLQKFLEYRNVDAQNHRDILKIGFSQISMEEIEKNDLVLSGNRYKRFINIDSTAWKVVKLSEVTEIYMGQSPEGQYYNEKKEGLPFYQGKTDFGNKYLKEPSKWTTQTIKESIKNDILMSVRAPVGPTNLAPFNLCIGRGLCAIRSNEDNLNYLFLFYCLRYIEKNIASLATGSTFKAIRKEDVENIKIPLPPIKFQNEIVEEVDSYQNIIDGAKQIVNSYKPSFEIDSEWETYKIGELCNLMTGGTPRTTEKKYYNNGDIRWLVSGDIHKGEIFDCEGRITKDGLENSNAKYLPINSVLIALNGQGKTRGTVALLRTKATCNQSIVSINPKDNNILIPEFLYYQLKERYQEIRNITGDKQRSGLNMPIIRNIKIYIPSVEKQKEIVEKIKTEENLIKPNKDIIELFENKIKEKLNYVWGK